MSWLDRQTMREVLWQNFWISTWHLRHGDIGEFILLNYTLLLCFKKKSQEDSLAVAQNQPVGKFSTGSFCSLISTSSFSLFRFQIKFFKKYEHDCWMVKTNSSANEIKRRRINPKQLNSQRRVWNLKSKPYLKSTRTNICCLFLSFFLNTY